MPSLCADAFVVILTHLRQNCNMQATTACVHRRWGGYLELAKVLGHLALLVHLDHQVKVALGILGGCGRVWPDHKLLATILIL